jgi:hypothetical protein
MTKIKREDLFGFWKAEDKKNKNEVHVVFRDSGKAHFSELKNTHEIYRGDFEVVETDENNTIIIKAEKLIKLEIIHPMKIGESFIARWEDNIYDFKWSSMIWAD